MTEQPIVTSLPQPLGYAAISPVNQPVITLNYIDVDIEFITFLRRLNRRIVKYPQKYDSLKHNKKNDGDGCKTQF